MDIVLKDGFANWSVLNDTIMGGSSEAICKMTSNGLMLKGNMVEERGGFVSCRSPLYSSPINLSDFSGLEIEIEGHGRTLKLGISCKTNGLDLSRFIYDGLKWIADLPTKQSGVTKIKVPFINLVPVVRAKSVLFPLKFNSSSINQFQILYSKFGQPGKFNPSFSSGPFEILLCSIKAYE